MTFFTVTEIIRTIRVPTSSTRTNTITAPHRPPGTSSEASERLVSDDLVVEAVVFVLVGARLADIGVIISADWQFNV